ncbi:MAG TPA: DNA-binding protein [Nitrosomonas sp.]|nr:DNA-binding protein [Nitrosomonas sp.]HMW21003.1 DNA-binding protein [Nitrosomonas sp.]HMY62167.1 DNA-binding protein [Nitrosomonas sp.]HMY91191.1 DNA-binding protein [Nitrosomonas sp.]HNA71495.1 DNA-binding protein [Nitrosomonas sp.]
MSTNLDHFQSIERITRPSLSTEEAAFYLNRKPQTLRCWAMRENGLIRPLRINGRLAWPVKEIKKVLGMEA